MRDAMVFAIFACGLTPRSALEIDDASLTRIDKIMALIETCRWGIHDISRVELNNQGLPRFNMPFELGLFLGARRFGSAGQRRKRCLVLDTDPYRFRECLSDISGQDVTPHNGDPDEVIAAVRRWLSDSLPEQAAPVPGGIEIVRRFTLFQSQLPEQCQEARIEVHELTFADYTRFVSGWLRGFSAAQA